MSYNAARAARPAQWPLLLAVTAAACLSIWFVRRDALNYLSLDPQRFTPYYWSRRYALLLHIGGGMLALAAGLAQFYLGLSGRTARLHRLLGRTYLVGVGAGIVGVCYLVPTFPEPIDWVYSSGLVGLAISWAVTTALGYRHIRRGSRAGHRAWMLRSYLVTFGFVILRVIQDILMGFGLDTEHSVALAAWLSWTVPLLLAEPLLRAQRRVAQR
ncbi:MAG: DUF2306 domain-containing protein [Gammaproteobacteria bacterium]|nr:DUF2306 domain-containing protein [Gammaproteobacteria bacterium]